MPVCKACATGSSRRRCSRATRRSSNAAEAERYGVGALPDSLAGALAALAEDGMVRSWMTPLMYEAYVAVKRSEVEAAEGVDQAELCARYGRIY